MNEEKVTLSMPMAVKTTLDQSGTSTLINAIDIEVTPASTPHRSHDADQTSLPDSVKLLNTPGEKPMREFPPVPEPLEIFKTEDTLADMSSGVEDEEHVEEEDVASIFHVPVATGIAIFDDQISSLHDDDSSVPEHPERPGRIALVTSTLINLGLYECCQVIPTRHAKVKELMAVHSRSYISSVEKCSCYPADRTNFAKLHQMTNVYCNEHTFDAASMACGSVLNVVEEVCLGNIRNGFCVVRPPGHHAGEREPKGYCWFNNVAVAARCAQQFEHVNRVLIVDWDVQFGNGLYKEFEKDPNVLYFSVHRHDHGKYFPHSPFQDGSVVGMHSGEGRSVNVAWNHSGLNDADYLAVWQHLLVPMAEEFRPDIVLIAAGFNGADGDPFGECNLTPGGYSQMLYKLMGFACGRVVVCLEGGSNPRSVANASAACVKTLLGYAPQPANNSLASSATFSAIQTTMQAQREYWTFIEHAYKCFVECKQGASYGKNALLGSKRKFKSSPAMLPALPGKRGIVTPSTTFHNDQEKEQHTKKVAAAKKSHGSSPKKTSTNGSASAESLAKALIDTESGNKNLMRLKGKIIPPRALYEAVEAGGGFDDVQYKRNWGAVRRQLKLEDSTSSGAQLRRAYEFYFLS
eukprot:Stramenopile-MAST_4_protein_2969